MIYAVVVAIVLMATGARLPLPLDHTFTILGGLSIPLMLLTLGHTLATLTVGAMWRGVSIAVFHLAMGMAVGSGVVRLFGFAGTERGVVILMAVMPVSVAAYLWVDRSVPEEAPSVAGYILVSTLLTVAVLPPVLTYWV